MAAVPVHGQTVLLGEQKERGGCGVLDVFSLGADNVRAWGLRSRRGFATTLRHAFSILFLQLLLLQV